MTASAFCCPQTPYNKTYLDLSSQLRLFLDDEQELGIRPDRYIAAIGEAEFARQASGRAQHPRRL